MTYHAFKLMDLKLYD